MRRLGGVRGIGSLRGRERGLQRGARVNFFNPSANTSVFAQVDVTFGDDLDGVGGKAGMRVTW